MGGMRGAGTRGGEGAEARRDYELDPGRPGQVFPEPGGQGDGGELFVFCCSHGCCCDHGINAICVVCMLAVFAIHIYMHIHTHTHTHTCCVYVCRVHVAELGGHGEGGSC